MARFIIFLSFLLCSVTDACSQNRYSLRSYGTDNGMPSNGVKGMQWDESTGFLWIATEAGITRFNGLDFKNFTKITTPHLTSERMTFLVRNTAGKIFTADQDYNVFEIIKNRLEFYGHYSQTETQPNNVFLIATSREFFQHSLHRKNSRDFFLTFHKLTNLSDTSCYLKTGDKLFYYS